MKTISAFPFAWFFIFSNFFISSWAADYQKTENEQLEGIPEVKHPEGSQIARFQRCHQIFSNIHSIIYHCRDIKLKKRVVIKYFRARVNSAFNNEVLIFGNTYGLSRAINLFEALVEGNKGYIVMEYARAGDFFDCIKNAAKEHQPINVRKYFYQMMEALAQLHGRRIAHRDVKTENFFMTIDKNGAWQIKIGDFGCSRFMPPGKETMVLDVGTEFTMAPEVYETKKLKALLDKQKSRRIELNGPNALIPESMEIIPEQDPFAADIYSAGVVLYNALTNSSPYGCPSIDDPLYAYMVRQGLEGLIAARRHSAFF